MIGDAVELVPRRDPLAIDDFLLDHVAGRGGGPIDGPRIGVGLAHLVDAALRDPKVPQPQHGAFEALVRLGTGPPPFGAHGDDQVRLRQLNLRAVEAEERLALLDVLTGLVDEELLDIAVGAHGDDRQQSLVVLDPADGADGADDRPGLDLLGLHPGALDLVEAYFDRARALMLVGIDGDVVHPHGVLLRHRRGVGRAHRVAVIKDLPLCFRRRGGLDDGGRGHRFGRPRVPETPRCSGSDANRQNDDEAVQTPHGASPIPHA